MEVAENQVVGKGHDLVAPTIIRVARILAGSPTGGDPSGSSDTIRMSQVRHLPVGIEYGAWRSTWDGPLPDHLDLDRPR